MSQSGNEQQYEYEWDENKRLRTLQERNLDFADAWRIFEADFKHELSTPRSGEDRQLAIALVEVEAAVLALVYTRRETRIRVISMRRASDEERKQYADARQNRLGAGSA